MRPEPRIENGVPVCGGRQCGFFQCKPDMAIDRHTCVHESMNMDTPNGYTLSIFEGEDTCDPAIRDMQARIEELEAELRAGDAALELVRKTFMRENTRLGQRLRLAEDYIHAHDECQNNLMIPPDRMQAAYEAWKNFTKKAE